MINNFEQICDMLDFSIPNTFYFVQILKRRKENPDMSTGVSVINNYFIYEKEDLYKLNNKIINDCTLHNARAYINPNRLDTEKIALRTAQKILDLIVLKDYKAVKNAYAYACGNNPSETTKRWVVDFDRGEYCYDEVKNFIEDLHCDINAFNKINYKIIAELPTKNGHHIITEPFNMKMFHDKYPNIDVNKNSPTILYIP